MRLLLWTLIRMNPALMLANLAAMLGMVTCYRAGDLRWALLFLILGLIALGIESKSRNPMAVAARQLRPRRRRIARPYDPSHN